MSDKKMTSTVEEDVQLELSEAALKAIRDRVEDGWAIVGFEQNMGMDAIRLSIVARRTG